MLFQLRRLFGAVSLRSVNRFFGGPAPPCGAALDAAPVRRRLAALGQSVLRRPGAALRRRA
jgi:hypothetical protein